MTLYISKENWKPFPENMFYCLKNVGGGGGIAVDFKLKPECKEIRVESFQELRNELELRQTNNNEQVRKTIKVTKSRLGENFVF